MTPHAWRELAAALSPILACLLMMLTPIGTGRGVHHGQLLDLVFPHRHFSNGLVLQQRATPRYRTQTGRSHIR
jgi:hypothetical protein